MVIVLLSYIITLMVVLGSNEGTSASTGLQDWHIGIIVLAIIVVLVIVIGAAVLVKKKRSSSSAKRSKAAQARRSSKSLQQIMTENL